MACLTPCDTARVGSHERQGQRRLFCGTISDRFNADGARACRCGGRAADLPSPLIRRALIGYCVYSSSAVARSRRPSRVSRDRSGEKAGCGVFMFLRACAAAFCDTPCQEDPTMAKGTVKWFRALNEGDEVEFEVVQGPKGPQAQSVTKTGATAR